jgi:hypothetical protein
MSAYVLLLPVPARLASDQGRLTRWVGAVGDALNDAFRALNDSNASFGTSPSAYQAQVPRMAKVRLAAPRSWAVSGWTAWWTKA